MYDCSCESLVGGISRGYCRKDVLSDAAADKDDHVLQAATVEDDAHLAPHRGQITAVDADATDCDAVGFQLRRQRYHFASAGLDVGGIDQEDHAFGPRAREILEARQLSVYIL